MSRTAIDSLESLIRKLHAERQGHFDSMAEIDAAFESLGLTARKPKKRKGRRGRPKQSAKKVGKKSVGKRAKRRKFKTTAAGLVPATIKRAAA